VAEKPAALSIRSFTSSESGAWSNAYPISGGSEIVLFDVPMLRRDAARLADIIDKSSKSLGTVMISHAHPDHFLSLDVIAERFPKAQITSTANVVEDLKEGGPGIFTLLKEKLGPEGPTRLVFPEPLQEPALRIEGTVLEVVEFGEAESRHTATLHVPSLEALICADLVYNNAHLYLAERHIEGWLARLNELGTFARDRISTIHSGHGPAGDLQLIEQTRRYLRDFAEAVATGDAETCERQLLAKYSDYHVRQFLTAFSVPAYFTSAPRA
jgi:glyoxylase-like metal-dependent hydrolase (beta-lactamase superfamily II)